MATASEMPLDGGISFLEPGLLKCDRETHPYLKSAIKLR